MTEFDELWADALPDLDTMRGEDFVLEPRMAPLKNGRPDVNARSIVDPERPVAGFRAIFTAIGSLQNAKGRSMADNTTMSVTGDSPYLRVTIPGEGFSRPQIGDHVLRQATGLRYRVGAALEREQDSLRIPLSRTAVTP